MSTGLTSFSDPSQIGALYPFPGVEVLLVVLAFVLWIGWHALQTNAENREYREALEHRARMGREDVPPGDSRAIDTEQLVPKQGPPTGPA
jgi:hypothetical protein